MYLESIEIQGFKSFANRIKFDFQKGITGIVGPNGSGKSNVADAVRWVLGEQRVKQLRGDAMQDVIFAGTENRRPLSYASVAITLNNADHQLAVEFKKVTVMRKLYRSGESEYLINGVQCRRKDIQEMFYDTGIGKEGYSIIGQGQIDQILSGKPEERRALFDEAAGIVKFKRRKTLSLKKLEAEEANLLRVNDILSELENQRAPLQEQAETAKIYLKKKEELKNFDINMFLLETERLKERSAKLTEQLANIEQEIAQAEDNYQTIRKETDTMEQQRAEMDAAIEESKAKLSETTLRKQQLEGQIDLLKEQINTIRTQDDQYDRQSADIQEELTTRAAQLEELQHTKDKLTDELAKAEQAVADEQERLQALEGDLSEKNEQLEAKQQALLEILNSRTSTSAKIQHFDTSKEQLQDQLAKLSDLLGTMDQQAGEENQALATAEQELIKAQKETTAYAQKISKLEEKALTYQQTVSTQQEALRQTQLTYHRAASRLESLKNMVERYDGYGNSIRKVMEQKEHIPGIHGVVADILQVDKKYEVAVETALGGSIQNIVTEDAKTAKQLIEYLKKNRFGRATFLPLTGIRSQRELANPAVLKETGVLGLASELVTAEKKYSDLIKHLLGRTVVADTIDTGIAIAKKYKQSIRLVTLEGELINPGGAMTGGAFKNSSNLLSRRREAEEAEKQVQRLQKEMEQAEATLAKTKEARAKCYGQLDELQKELGQVSITENTAKLNVEQIQLRLVELSNRRQAYETEVAETTENITKLTRLEESIRAELEDSHTSENTLHREIEALQKAVEADQERKETSVKESEEVRLQFVSMQQQVAFVEENIHRIQEERAKFQEDLQKLTQEKKEIFAEIQRKEKEIQEIQNTIANSGDLFGEIQQEIDKRIAQKEALLKKNKASLEKREELSKHRADLDKEQYRLQSQKESYEGALEKQIDYMWEEYEITYNHAKTMRDENLTDISYMKKQIQQLKDDMKQLGIVNVNAIQQFKEVDERYTFLKNQHDDLIEAKEKLLKIVDDLDVAMRKQFKEQFARISKEFNDVFKELFGGGKGTLELLDEEDILEAGIRIIAQPPGKKLQNMMQLSGGEKALTAISLLFAIQNLKPSPFCLLDEIEAALDDSNVIRYAGYLHKLTEHTQFIVITHRRGTMSAADRLYGITMQEKGVSTLVSVDLLENELEQ